MSGLSQFLRYKPEPLEYAQIDCQSQDGEFRPHAIALINDESFTGAGLVTQTSLDKFVHKKITVQVGRLAPMKAELMWQKQVDADIFRIGIKFLD